MPSQIEAIIARSPVALLLARHKKHADATLYRVLTDCLEISELCLSAPEELKTLNRLIKELPLLNNNGRLYVEQGSDVYQRTCRFMFHGEEHTANINRYAICLREAAKQSIKSSDLFAELKNGGGINRFYLARSNLVDQVSTKCLRLDRSIVHLKQEAITLKLRRNPDNSYQVLEITRG